MKSLDIQTVQMIEVADWNEFVSQVYGRPYDFQQQEGCRHRGIYRITVPDEVDDYVTHKTSEVISGRKYGVTFDSWLARDPKDPLPNQQYDWELTMWWDRNFYPMIEAVANDLHAKGLLAAGEYIINIDW